MSGNEQRPGRGTEALSTSTLATYLHDTDCERCSRCAECGRQVWARRSVLRGVGPHCWARLQLRDRRRAVRLQLGALTGAIDALSGPALLTLSDALSDSLDAIAGEVL